MLSSDEDHSTVFNLLTFVTKNGAQKIIENGMVHGINSTSTNSCMSYLDLLMVT